MSIQDAFRLIEALRADPHRAREFDRRCARDGLDGAAGLAAALGLDCDAAELRRAFALDWHLRWALYGPSKTPSDEDGP